MRLTGRIGLTIPEIFKGIENDGVHWLCHAVEYKPLAEIVDGNTPLDDQGTGLRPLPHRHHDQKLCGSGQRGAVTRFESYHVYGQRVWSDNRKC